jgi:LAO/AO transport system kinase
VDAVSILAAAVMRRCCRNSGVGQDEVEIVKAADVCVVVLVPGMGDDIQAIKAGIMEIADIFVINKADQRRGYSTEKELEALLSLAHRGRWLAASHRQDRRDREQRRGRIGRGD